MFDEAVRIDPNFFEPRNRGSHRLGSNPNFQRVILSTVRGSLSELLPPEFTKVDLRLIPGSIEDERPELKIVGFGDCMEGIDAEAITTFLQGELFPQGGIRISFLAREGHTGHAMRVPGAELPGTDSIDNGERGLRASSGVQMKVPKAERRALEEEIKRTIPILCEPLQIVPLRYALPDGGELPLVHLGVRVASESRQEFDTWIRDKSKELGVLIIPTEYEHEGGVKEALASVFHDNCLITQSDLDLIEHLIEQIEGYRLPSLEEAKISVPLVPEDEIIDRTASHVFMIDGDGVDYRTDAFGFETLGDGTRVLTHYVSFAGAYITPESLAYRAARSRVVPLYVDGEEYGICHSSIVKGLFTLAEDRESLCLATEIKILPNGKIQYGAVYPARIKPSDAYTFSDYASTCPTRLKEQFGAAVDVLDADLNRRRPLRKKVEGNAPRLVQTMNEAAKVGFAEWMYRALQENPPGKAAVPFLFKGNASGSASNALESLRILFQGKDSAQILKSLWADHQSGNWPTLLRTLSVLMGRSHHASAPLPWVPKETGKYADNKPHSLAGIYNQMCYVSLRWGFGDRDTAPHPDFTGPGAAALAEIIDDARRELPFLQYRLDFLKMLLRQLSRDEPLNGTIVLRHDGRLQIEADGFKRWVDLEVPDSVEKWDRFPDGSRVRATLLGFNWETMRFVARPEAPEEEAPIHPRFTLRR